MPLQSPMRCCVCLPRQKRHQLFRTGLVRSYAGIIASFTVLGSARVSRVGDRVLAIVDFSKDCFGETPKRPRETRALLRVNRGEPVEICELTFTPISECV